MGRSGLVLTGLAVGDRLLLQTGQAIAAPVGRKWALLIGVNQYPEPSLKGCLTDLDLQRELLIHRCGFQAGNVTTLADGQATFSAIVAAFNQLTQQVQTGDRVVIHFSGFGRLGAIGEAELLLADTQALPESQLVDWLQQLPTDQITTVLDTSFVYPGDPRQGNLRHRSRPAAAFVSAIAPPIYPGVVLTASDRDQLATELDQTGWSAGQFTAAWVQTLWQALPGTTLQVSLGHTRPELKGQTPGLAGKQSRDSAIAPFYTPLETARSVGAVTGINLDTQTADLWLAGVRPSVLEALLPGSHLVAQDAAGDRRSLEVTERSGLRAKAHWVGASPAVGQLLQEQIRVVSRNLDLTVALDSSLTKIERVDAVSALSTLSHVNSIAAGEGSADYLLAKVQEPAQIAALPNAPISELITPAGYGLFSTGKAAIPNTTGEAGEAVKIAVKRLTPTLQTLRAQKLLRSTENRSASELALQATLEMVIPKPQTLFQQSTAAATPKPSNSQPANRTVPIPVSVGQHLRYQIRNLTANPLFWLLISWDDRRNTTLILPSDPTLAQIASGTTQALASSPTNTEWVVRHPIGQIQTYLLFSTAPFSQTQTLLPKDAESFLHPIDKPLNLVQAILQDLQQASPSAQALATPETIALDHQTWATLSFLYQVV